MRKVITSEMRKLLQPLIGMLLFLIYQNTSAQTAEASSTIAKNIFQIELESVYTVQKEDDETMKSWSIPSALFRFGVINGLELQLNTPIIKEELWENDHLVHSLNKFDDIQFGLSLNLWKQEHIFPEASIMLRSILPTDSKFKDAKIGYIISLNLANSLSEKFLLTYNIGYAVETDNSKSAFYIVNLNFDASSKYHFFMETFGDFANNEFSSVNIVSGVGCNFNKQLTFDLSVANGINHSLFYVGGILTYALNTQKNKQNLAKN